MRSGRSLAVQPNCLKGRVVCGTVYGEMHLKDLMGSFVRVRYRIPFPDFYLVLSSLPKKHYNGLNQTKPINIIAFCYTGPDVVEIHWECGSRVGYHGYAHALHQEQQTGYGNTCGRSREHAQINMFR